MEGWVGMIQLEIWAGGCGCERCRKAGVDVYAFSKAQVLVDESRCRWIVIFAAGCALTADDGTDVMLRCVTIDS